MKNQSKPSEYSIVCGLEIHAELKTNSKMFCGCKNDPFNALKPNIYTCPICLGMPGGIPIANKKAIEWTLKLGLAIGCKINLFSKFDRKHYFYPDLPKSYQISQYDLPFCYDGKIETSEGVVRIRRIHLEEDTGKLIHKTITQDNRDQKVSLIDFNRSGVPLIEIVTEADIKSSNQAKEFGKKLRQIMRYLDIADCDMEQGGMRLEANVSLRSSDSIDPVGKNQEDSVMPNYKVEVKNINSFRFLEQAIEFESQRQAILLKNGKVPTQETRGWDSHRSVTFSQRIKEDAKDYRYFPDPDIPPIRISKTLITKIKSQLPELADSLISKWSIEYEIDPKISQILTQNQATATLFDSFASQVKKNQIFNNVELKTLASLIVNKKVETSLLNSPQELMKVYLSLTQKDEVDEQKLQAIITQILDNNPDVVAKFKAGKTQVIGYIVGQAMAKLGKKVDAQVIRSKILEIIKK
jgi:aspartyl-tRNA(Asn)/glutamyl-tRNA(Gln) amidotransferase subunit B